ncbi:MAG: hypothetical protein F4X95_01695 [Oligoflexia bacterium]|nr:hypothetical protein [Oligoflexia bacterium]
MNTTGGIFVLLSIVLFIFSSFDVEARSTARSAKEVARRIIEKDPDLAQKEAELIFKLEAVREYLSDLDPTLNKNFDPMKAVHEINKNFISIESIQAREVPTASEISNINVNTYLLARQKTSPVFISSERASSIVEVLSYKLGEGKVSETTKKNLTEAIQLRNSIIGPSLLKLAQKVESARTEDVEVIVKFAENIKDIQPTAKNERNPEVANILLDLGQNLHDMPFWDAQPRTTVMSVLKTFNDKLNKKATK